MKTQTLFLEYNPKFSEFERTFQAFQVSMGSLIKYIEVYVCSPFTNFAISLHRDNKGQTPYIVAPDKDTRNVFRKYMGENPDKYDYSKAQVRINYLTVNFIKWKR